MIFWEVGVESCFGGVNAGRGVKLGVGSALPSFASSRLGVGRGISTALAGTAAGSVADGLT